MSLETLLEAAQFLEWSRTGDGSQTQSSRDDKSLHNDGFYSCDTKGRCSSDDNTESDDMRDIKRSLGTRATHNKLEKNRRAQLKECFEALRQELPNADERRTSNLATLRSSLRLIETLALQQRELEAEKRRMQRIRTNKQTQLQQLKQELKDKNIIYNLDDWLNKNKAETNSTSTASECGDVNAVDAEESAGVKDRNAELFIHDNGTQGDLLSSMERSPNGELHTPDGLVVETPPQAIQMMQQVAVKVSLQQRLSSKYPNPKEATAPTHSPHSVVPTNAGLGRTLLKPRDKTDQSKGGTGVTGVSAAQVPAAITLQTGKFIQPRRAYPKSANVDVTCAAEPLSHHVINHQAVNIAPKQLVLITDQRKLQPICSVPLVVPSYNGVTFLQSASGGDIIPYTSSTSTAKLMMPTASAASTGVSYMPLVWATKPLPVLSPDDGPANNNMVAASQHSLAVLMPSNVTFPKSLQQFTVVTDAN